MKQKYISIILIGLVVLNVLDGSFKNPSTLDYVKFILLAAALILGLFNIKAIINPIKNGVSTWKNLDNISHIVLIFSKDHISKIAKAIKNIAFFICFECKFIKTPLSK